ncbi:MAG TPA: lytic transglycosylase domain-containing protein [Acidobacteriota bacterium]|nr:lytic transglycosylase domain-containing protein [Acidobacteriota bacterium]
MSRKLFLGPWLIIWSIVLAQAPPWSDDVFQVRKLYVQGENALLAGDTNEAEKQFAKAFEKASEVHRQYPDRPELNEFLQGLQSTFERLQIMHRIAIIVAPPQKREVPAILLELPKIDLYTYPIEISPKLAGTIKKNLKEARYDLPVTLNEDVMRAMNFFLKNQHGRRLMEIGMRRIGLYEEYIRSTFRKAGIPADLIYLAQLESNFFPDAASSAEAVGLWQFVADTGLRYGLKLDWWVDERMDPYKSTQAAARYLKDLHARLGDWYLVLASYNTGEGRIIPLVRKAGSDFWRMSNRKLLPQETRNFVPLILAIAVIAKNPDEFGFQVKCDSPESFETLAVKWPVSLKTIARRVKIDLDKLRELNPELKQDITPQYSRAYVLRLPAGTSKRVATLLAKLSPKQRLEN